jgi:hypothetical protein
MGQEHRERVFLALSFKEPDRVPKDLSGFAWPIIDVPPYGYRKLCDFLKIKDVVSLYRSSHTFVVYPLDERILRHYDIDFRYIRMNESIKEISKEIKEDCWEVKCKNAGTFYYPIDHPLKKVKNFKEVEVYDKWPDYKNPLYIKNYITE